MTSPYREAQLIKLDEITIEQPQKLTDNDLEVTFGTEKVELTSKIDMDWRMNTHSLPTPIACSDGRKPSRWGNRLSRRECPTLHPPKLNTSHRFRRLWYLPTEDLCQQIDPHSSEVARSAGEELPGRSWGRERGERVIQ